jgi:phosphatidylglycerophosphate synthase
MTFLDTVDGKLARVTLTSSRIGDVLDHGLDLLHPPFWYLAWGIGLATAMPVATGIAVAG